MPPTRPTRTVLVATSDRPLADAVHAAVADAADLRVIPVDGGEVELLVRAGQEAADLVVLAMTERTLPALAERLLDEYPQVGVLAVDLDRDEGLFHQLSPDTSVIHEIAAVGLAGVLRLAAAGRIPRAWPSGPDTGDRSRNVRTLHPSNGHPDA